MTPLTYKYLQVCRSWSEVCRSGQLTLRKLDMSPFQQLQDAELLFLIRKFHADIEILVSSYCVLADRDKHFILNGLFIQNLNGCKYLTDTPLIKYASYNVRKLR